MEWLLATVLKPFGALLIFGGIAFPIRWAIHKYMKDGWLKKQLLAERFKSTISASHRKLVGDSAADSCRKPRTVTRFN